MLVIIRQYTGAREDFPRNKMKYVDTILDGISEVSVSYDDYGTLDVDVHTDMEARTTYHDAHLVRALSLEGGEIMQWERIPMNVTKPHAELEDFDKKNFGPDLKSVT